MKKNIIRTISLFIAFIMISFCAGCSLKMQSVDQLMHPPRPSGVYEELQKTFVKTVGKDVITKSPAKGDYRSSFVLYDIDGDSIEEAFIFYAPKNNPTEVHMLFFKKGYDDEKWTLICNIVGAGSDVSSVSFSDLNGDGVYEVILGWKAYGENYVMSVYKCNTGNGSIDLSELSKLSFSAMKVVDMDQDGNDEIFLIEVDNNSDSPRSIAKMLKMNKNSITVVGEVTVNSNVSGYLDILVEEASSQKPLKLYIDANVGDEAMVTDVVYWDSTVKSLRAPISNPAAQMNPITYRQAKIKSQDINGDGIIEIPQLIRMDGSAYATNNSSDKNRVEVTDTKPLLNNESFLYYVYWNQQNGGQFSTVLYSAINSTDGYIFKFTNEWVKRITIISNTSEHKWTFFEWNSEKSSLGEELFSIVTVPLEKWSESPLPEYKILKQNDVTVYAYKIADKAFDYNISESILNTNLVIL